MMSFFKLYIRQRRMGIIAFAVFSAVFAVSFVLYHLPVKAVLYPALICLIIGTVFLFFDIRSAYAKHKYLGNVQSVSGETPNLLPPVKTADDADYRMIIERMTKEQNDIISHMETRYSEMTDYYTIWAHQIKNPIASMRLRIQNDDSLLNRKLASDLLRIEQYVEMVLMFLRLDSDSTDYVIREYDLDGIVRQAVKKFADDFISRKLKLEYEPLNTSVVTDEKWLLFVVEQVISNALKYTYEGSISIWLEEPKALCIGDTGIGIAPEDLPRVFDKGYTGYNGRNDKKASGIGLYLCKRICANLSHKIKLESVLGKGTVVYIDLNRTEREYE